MKWLLGAAGLALLAAGAVRAVLTGGQPGIVMLIVAGGVLALSPFVIDRLESVSAGTGTVEVRFSQQVIELGAPRTGKILAQTGLAALADSYAFAHLELPPDRFPDARVYLQDLLVDRSVATAQSQKLDAREVRTLLRDGSPVMRVLAVGLMIGDTSLADGASVVAAITESQSANEQYHGLSLAQQCWPRLGKADRQAVRAAVANAVEEGAIPPDSDRRPLADALLALPVGLCSPFSRDAQPATLVRRSALRQPVGVLESRHG